MPSETFDDALGAFSVLEERIGRGATGEVWRGVDRRTGAVVAAEVLTPSTSRTARSYLGPGAVKLSDFGVAEIVADDPQDREKRHGSDADAVDEVGSGWIRLPSRPASR